MLNIKNYLSIMIGGKINKSKNKNKIYIRQSLLIILVETALQFCYTLDIYTIPTNSTTVKIITQNYQVRFKKSTTLCLKKRKVFNVNIFFLWMNIHIFIIYTIHKTTHSFNSLHITNFTFKTSQKKNMFHSNKTLTVNIK